MARLPTEVNVNKTEEYRSQLRTLTAWEPYLLRESRLPGPRGNLELAHAVAEEGDAALFWQLSKYDAERAPTNTPGEFLAFCGVLGLGKLLVEGHADALEALRRHASDPRWRTREAVAMALQRLGAHDMSRLLEAVRPWVNGGLLEQRAVAAALCEPALLGDKAYARDVLDILDAITASLETTENRRNDAYRALRQGLAYCWSVAVVASPEEGKLLMEKWLTGEDPDVRWIMKENLKKQRLKRMDAAWVEHMVCRVQEEEGRRKNAE